MWFPVPKITNTHLTRGFSQEVNHSEYFVLIFCENGFVLHAQGYQKASSVIILTLNILKPIACF